jgi:hypothetical protein
MTTERDESRVTELAAGYDLHAQDQGRAASSSRAARIQFVMDLLHPPAYLDADGVAVTPEPLITKDQALAILAREKA